MPHEHTIGDYDCSNCSKKVVLTAKNTVHCVFTRQHQFNHLLVQCGCGTRTRYWSDAAEQAKAALMGCRVFLDEWADDNVVAGWYEIKGIKPLEPVALTPRLEEEVTKLGEVLANCPDELLWETLTAPAPPSSMPATWVDQ